MILKEVVKNEIYSVMCQDTDIINLELICYFKSWIILLVFQNLVLRKPKTCYYGVWGVIWIWLSKKYNKNSLLSLSDRIDRHKPSKSHNEDFFLFLCCFIYIP